MCFNADSFNSRSDRQSHAGLHFLLTELVIHLGCFCEKNKKENFGFLPQHLVSKQGSIYLTQLNADENQKGPRNYTKNKEQSIMRRPA